VSAASLPPITKCRLLWLDQGARFFLSWFPFSAARERRSGLRRDTSIFFHRSKSSPACPFFFFSPRTPVFFFSLRPYEEFTRFPITDEHAFPFLFFIRDRFFFPFSLCFFFFTPSFFRRKAFGGRPLFLSQTIAISHFLLSSSMDGLFSSLLFSDPDFFPRGTRIFKPFFLSCERWL